MKKAIMEALNGSEKKYFSIMQKTRQKDIVAEKWKVFKILADKRYSQTAIAEYFGMHPSAVSHALDQTSPYPKKKECKIPFSLIEELEARYNNDVRTVFFKLKRIGYSQTLIAKTFNVAQSTVSRYIHEYISRKEFEKKRSKIIKLR